MYRGRGGNGDRSDGDRLGMETDAVGIGLGWVQCSRGRAGMGFSFCSRADL